jgi:hypothetical protein
VFGNQLKPDLFAFDPKWWGTIFIQIPSALAGSIGSNAMCVIFYLWIYLLGFSTLTAILWGQVSILNDLKYFKKLTKPTLLILLLVI